MTKNYNKSDNIYLKHIYESIEAIEDYIDGFTFDNFLGSMKTQDAVIRRLLIIGEAAKKVSTETKESNKKIPWRDMAGMRDVLVHDYFGVDLFQVWGTCQDDLPKLKQEIKNILKLT